MGQHLDAVLARRNSLRAAAIIGDFLVEPNSVDTFIGPAPAANSHRLKLESESVSPASS